MATTKTTTLADNTTVSVTVRDDGTINFDEAFKAIAKAIAAKIRKSFANSNS